MPNEREVSNLTCDIEKKRRDQDLASGITDHERNGEILRELYGSLEVRPLHLGGGICLLAPYCKRRSAKLSGEGVGGEEMVHM